MAKPTAQISERKLDLGDGYAIWYVHFDSIREADKNAREMHAADFERLVANISESGGLYESLPLCYLKPSAEGHNEFLVISGHHRLRAGSKSGQTMFHVIAYEKELSRSQIIAKQLAHNRIAGQDNPQLLLELYNEIEDLDAKLASGINNDDIAKANAELAKFEKVQIDEVNFELSFDKIELLFLPHQFKDWEKAVEMISKDARTVGIADHAMFDEYVKTVREVSKRDNIINLSTIMARMCEIVRLYMQEHPPEPKPEEAKTE